MREILKKLAFQLIQFTLNRDILELPAHTNWSTMELETSNSKSIYNLFNILTYTKWLKRVNIGNIISLVKRDSTLEEH